MDFLAKINVRSYIDRVLGEPIDVWSKSLLVFIKIPIKYWSMIDFTLIFDLSYRKSMWHSVVLSSLDDIRYAPPL